MTREKTKYEVKNTEKSVDLKGINESIQSDLSISKQLSQVDISSFTSDINDLRGMDISAITNSISDLEKIDISAITNSISDLRKIDISAITNSISDLRKIDISAITNSISDLRRMDISAITNSISDLGKIDISPLTTSISDLGKIDVSRYTKVADKLANIEVDSFITATNQLSKVDTSRLISATNQLINTDLNNLMLTKTEINAFSKEIEQLKLGIRKFNIEDLLESSNIHEKTLKEFDTKKDSNKIGKVFKALIIFIYRSIFLIAALAQTTEFVETKVYPTMQEYLYNQQEKAYQSEKEALAWINKEIKKETSTQLIKNFRIVSKEGLIVREGKRKDSRMVGQLDVGYIVQILEKRKNWTYILYSDYESNEVIEGWVYTRYLKKIE